MPTHRVFKDKKAFQYNWYTSILNTTTTSPLILLRHNDFTVLRLTKLRTDIAAASKRPSQSLTSPLSLPDPTLTVIRSSVFGAALREFPNIDLDKVSEMIEGQSGALAALSLPNLDPLQLKAILRAFERGVPPRKPKTPEELAKALQEKNADPATPGRRIKRARPTLQPELRVVGAIFNGQILLPEKVKDISTLPSLETLHAQIVGLLSSPGMQLAGVLSTASGGRLARTLEGFRRGLEGPDGDASSPNAQGQL